MNRILGRICLPCAVVPLAALALALLALSAAADPMRPLKPPAPAATKEANGKPGQPRKTAEETEEAAPPRIALMALRLNSDGRWRALVGDQWVSVGDRLGARVVVAIDSNRLELTEGPQRITVHLLPWLQPASPAEAPAREPARDTEVRQARAPVDAREGPRKP